MFKSKILIPSPLDYKDSRSFFAELVRLNKANSTKFSYRMMAAYLSWPVSYLPDIISGRKKFSVNRAVEFVQKFNLKGFKSERIYYYAINDISSSGYVEEIKINSKPTILLNPSVDQSLELVSDASFVMNVLFWLQKKIDVDEIYANYNFSGIGQSRIQKALKYIDDKKIFEWTDSNKLLNYDENKMKLVNDNYDGRSNENPFLGIELHRDYAHTFLQFIQNPQAPASYISRAVFVPKGQFMAIATKVLELRNWIDELSSQFIADKNLNHQNSYLMQLDLNLFPLYKHKQQKDQT